MKTKIVYVLSSDDSDVYYEQAYLSLYSLKVHCPNAYTELVVDERTDMSLRGGRTNILQHVDKKNLVTVPSKYNKAQVSRWLKTNLRMLVEGDFLFLDTDTVITDDLAEIDNCEYDIGAVKNCHVKLGLNPAKKRMSKWAERDGWTYSDDLVYYNSGVLFVKDCELSRNLFDSWHKKWAQGLTINNHLQDQTYLAAANEELDFPIQELPGIWNCQLIKNGLAFFCNAKIIHYLNYGVFCKSIPWGFYNPKIYQRIKEEKNIPDNVAKMIAEAKEQFPETNSIVAGDELKLRQSPLFDFFLKYPLLYKMTNPIAYITLSLPKLYRKIVKKISK